MGLCLALVLSLCEAFCVGMELKNNPGDPPGDIPEGRPRNNSYVRDGGGTAELRPALNKSCLAGPAGRGKGVPFVPVSRAHP